MKETFNLKTQEIRQNCIDFLLALDGEKVYTVTIKDEAESRSAAQLRLKWKWMGFLAKEKAGEGEGLSAQGWNAFFKKMFIKQLLLAQDEDYAEVFADIREKAILLKAGLSQEKYGKAEAAMWDEIKTEWLTVKNMKAYMDQINIYCTMSLGVVLPVPDDLKWLSDKENK